VVWRSDRHELFEVFQHVNCTRLEPPSTADLTPEELRRESWQLLKKFDLRQQRMERWRC
jgi:hypothetical protein